MTPSPTPAVFPRTASRPARRTRLLAASALCGVALGGAAAMLAQPVLAQTLPGIPGGGSITVSAGGTAPAITAPNANTLDVDLNAPRTVINWSSLHVSSADAMIFHFDTSSDIVLNKTTSQIAIDAGGTVSGLVGASAGGNIWFYSPQGVIVSPGAVMSAGNFVFSQGAGVVDASFVAAADPTAFLRAASTGLIQISTITSATSASIDNSGVVVLSQSSGPLNSAGIVVVGTTATVSTGAGGSISVSEVTATTGVASVLAGGPGATVTQITGATGVVVSSGANSSVNSATTTTATGDILITSGGSVSLTQGNSGRDLTLSADQVFTSTLDVARDVIITGTTSALVTNRIFAGDDIEVTSGGTITANGATLRSTGLGADADAHVLVQSIGGSVSVNNATTQGTGAAAGDVTIEAAMSASLNSGTATRDMTISGRTVGLGGGAAARDLFVTGTTGGVVITTFARAGDDVEVTATTGNVVAGAATLTSTGVGAIDDAHVLVRSTGDAVAVGSALTQGTGIAAGDVTINGATTATLGSASSSQDLIWTANSDLDLSGNYTAARTVSLTATGSQASQSGGIITAGALAVQATGGITLNRANMIDSVSSLAASLSTDVTLTNAKDLSIDGAVTGRDVTITTTAGALSVGTASFAVSSDLRLTGATGFTSGSTQLAGYDNVILTATTGDALVGYGVTNGLLAVRAPGGAATLRNALIGLSGGVEVTASGTATLGADSLAGVTAANSANQVNNLGTFQVASTNGDARVFLDFLAVDHLTVGANSATGTASIGVDGGFAVDLVSGHNVVLDAANGTIDATTVTVGGGDYTAKAQDWVGAALLNPPGTIANLSITDTDGGLVLTNALTATGNLTLESFDTLSSAYDLTAGGDIGVTAAGDIDLVSATAGGSISVASTAGGAILRKADLTGTGAGHDLSITADGDAVLGDPDYSAITTDNVFSRSGGGTGTAIIRSTTGAAMAHLDTSAALDILEGASVDATIVSGAGAFGTITALTGDAYVEVLDGPMTVDTATAANGDLDLYASGGDLTVTGALHGAGLVHVETDGLLDGILASLISSDGDLELIGGDVDLGRVTATGMVEVTATTGNALVQEAVTGGTVVVASFAGDATLRGAEGPDGIAVIALNKATFGADDKALITAANYAVTNVSCNCGLDGLQVLSFDGDAVVNIDSASNGIALVAAAIDGDATVVQKTGDLKIAELAGYNITLEAMAGTLETGFTTSSGGDYTITAHDFLGDALTPTLFAGPIHDFTVADTLGDLDLGTTAIHAGHWLTILASDGAVTGAAQLSAGSGLNDARVTVTGEGVAVDMITSDGLVNLDGGNGLVDVATSVDVWGNYGLRGGDFANAALTPQGAMLGTWTTTDRVGGFDFSGKTLHYGGALFLFVHGVVNGGDITVDTHNIYSEVDSGHFGTLTAPEFVGATATVGDIDVDLIQAGTIARVRTTGSGTAHLRAANMTGAGATQVLIQSFDGDAILGAATPGAITAANVVTSIGTTPTVDVSATGRIDINLDHITGTNLTTVDAGLGVAVKVANGPLTISGLVHSASKVSIASRGGLTIASTGKVVADGGGDAVVLASDGVFTNARGADAVTAANGRWLIYTQAFGDPLGSTAGNSFNGLAGKNFYGSVYNFGAGTFAVAPNAGNRFVYAYQPTLTVTPDSRNVIYNGAIPTTSATITGVVNGDLTADAWSGAPTILGATSKAVGTYALTVNVGSLLSDLNYAFDYTGTGALRIDPKVLTGALTANDRIYDGTTVATGSIGLTGVVTGDTVLASGAYAFADKTAATGKTVTASGVVLSGADAGNYILASTGADTADILKKNLTGVLTASNKTYDGATTAMGSISLTGVAAGDVVTVSGAYAFVDRNAGTGKTVMVSGAALAGLDAANYDLSSVSNGLADILRRQVTVAADPAFKTFGLSDPVLTYRVTVGDLVAGDAFTGGLARAAGEGSGDYGILRGTLGLSTNYDLTFTGAVFTIRPFLSNDQDGSMALKHVTQSPDFTLDWDPEPNLATEGLACPGAGCPPQAAGGGQVVAALR